MVWETTEEKLTRRLDKEKDYLWKAIEEIKLQLKENLIVLSTLEKSAPEHFKKTVGTRNKVSEIKNKAQERQDEIEAIFKNIESCSEHIDAIRTSVEDQKEEIESNSKEASNSLSDIYQNQADYQATKTDVEEALEELKKLIDEKNLLSSKIESLSEQVEASETQSQRLKSLLSGATKERNSIRELYNEVYGYTFEDDDGVEQREEGLKGHLDTSYHKIKEDLITLQNYSNTIETESTDKLLEIESKFVNKLESFTSSAEKKYQAISNQITSLLPGALTAGLSGAYIDKIKIEKEQLEKHEKSFNRSIFGLISCSVLPVFFVMVRVIFMKEDFGNVLKDTPTLYSMMLPVYAPILWMAYSSNKSYKLSKRLIEEYTHKEVSSRTFEGLSNQIAQIGESDSNGELRTKLLYNLLQVNSENPGKLISDYNNSDHPIIDAIDKSSKLADALNKLDNVPLISPLLKHLNAKEQAKLEKKAQDMSNVVDVEIEQASESKEPSLGKATA
ncbi:hypothetical protein [Vibrio tasmaniensis]|uniref:hypothetical protein n=1 Tax=Vibrio tasmaniensis TaxID=212663 RepID=UPI001080D191|nr:hypothetical protein [Vibrio tasmaniensis]